MEKLEQMPYEDRNKKINSIMKEIMLVKNKLYNKRAKKLIEQQYKEAEALTGVALRENYQEIFDKIKK